MFEFLKPKTVKRPKPLSIGTVYGSTVKPGIAKHPECVGTSVTSIRLNEGERFIGFDKNALIVGHIFVYNVKELSSDHLEALKETARNSGKKLGKIRLSEYSQCYRVDNGENVRFLVNPRLLKLNNWINLDDVVLCKSSSNAVGK